MRPLTGPDTLRRTDRSRIISCLDYLEKELPFHLEYEREVNWQVYQKKFLILLRSVRGFKQVWEQGGGKNIRWKMEYREFTNPKRLRALMISLPEKVLLIRKLPLL